MTKAKMIKAYRNLSVANSYIVGFTYQKKLYYVEMDEIAPVMLNVEKASRNQGENLRLRIKADTKKSLMHNKPVCLGSADILIADKYNKGEIFEKLVTEHFNQTWEKDTVPFWEDGDLTVYGMKVQIKLDSATLMNTKQMEKMGMVA